MIAIIGKQSSGNNFKMSCHSLDKKSGIDSTSISLIRIILLKPCTCEKSQMSVTVASKMEEGQRGLSALTGPTFS